MDHDGLLAGQRLVNALSSAAETTMTVSQR
jgi:hypothetical protein